METTKDEILDLERRFWSADPKFYQERMEDDVIVVMEPMGFIPKDKAVAIADQTEGWTNVMFSDVHVLELSPDCTAVAYHGEAKGADGKPQRSSVSSTYVRRNGKWRLAMTSHQPWPNGEQSKANGSPA
ncbi:MAG TPA: nuclear transport factor 2 family protein [Fimbriimonadaceae bacterium]|nr:nuclear transport factor 2 family protein [Fimbriimonadaceae bacterium]